MRLAMLLTLLALACQLPAAASACASPLRLNEILAGPARDWDGSGAFSSRDDEWVEVVNTGPGTLDLAGHILTDGDSIPRFALSGTLGPGERLLVTGRMAYDWERANGQPAFGLSLGNSGDAVLLWEVAGADTVLVDAYAYRSHEAAADRSVARVPDGTGAWALMDGLNPYAGSTPPLATGCSPTPGAANGCGSTPVRHERWGALKRRYR
uniref:Lamin tail domain-containing protein n=1 Tax=Eiseniibacteriota bacterium TaxID=2212470 RepID=A0A832I3E9_UNCEI